MNYTENYHLPQWEENDRVMRADFNDAMGALESGLTEAAELARSLSAEESSARERLEKGLFRAAYNHYHCLSNLPAPPTQPGVWQQDFQRDTVTVSNAVSMDGRIWTSGCSQQLTYNLMKATVKETSLFSATCDTYTLTFTPPVAGVLTSIMMEGRCSDNNNGNRGDCTLTLWNLTTGKVEDVVSSTFDIKYVNVGGGFSLKSIGLALHANQKYQLDIKLNTLDFVPDIKCNLDYTYCMSFQNAGPSPVSLSYSFPEDLPSLGGVFIAHYMDFGSGNRVTLRWPESGEELEPTKVREITDQHGRTVKEAEFRVWKSLPGPGKVVLKLQGGDRGDISLYEWGGVLI